MNRSQIAWIALLIAFPEPAVAQLAPPMIRSSKPIGAGPGETVVLEVRGSDVRDGASIRFDDPRVKVEGSETGKAEANGLRTIQARVSIPSEAGPGPIRFRIIGDGGVSNPGQILVGRSIRSIVEAEPNNSLRKPQAVAGPVAIEGTIAPGDDVDVYAIEMKAGETLVAEAIASRAGSRLDALVTILSPEGHELAASDDLFGKDAAAWATVFADGRYLVVIQDAEGRHRDGGIEQKMTRPYRLEVGRLTLVSSVFPSGTQRGKEAWLRLQGANLPEGGLARFDPSADSPLGDRLFAFSGMPGGSNPWNLRVGDGDEHAEPEPNGKATEAPVVLVPGSIDGQFSDPDDLDSFRLKVEPGREGDYIISAYAARIGSPADPVLASLDAKGEPQGEDDDKLGRDARMERRIDSKDGLLVSIRDYYGRGGSRFQYRIEVEPVSREVVVAVEVGHRTIPRSGALIVPISLDRKGYQGLVTIQAEALPDGVSLGPLSIEPAGSKGFLVFSAASDASIAAFSPRLVAREVPAEFRYRERGALDEIPREGDQNKGPRETSVEINAPVLAIADRAMIGLSAPLGPIVVAPDGRTELNYAVERRGDSASKRIKVRLVAAEKALDRFEPIGVLDLAPDANSAIFALKPKPGTKPGDVTLAAHAWLDGSPELLGVDSAAVVLKIR